MEETQTWLNEEFVSQMLKASVDDIKSINFESKQIMVDDTEKTNGKEIIVVDYNVKKAIEDGKNFTSIIYKVKIKYKESTEEIQQKSFIVKIIVTTLVGVFGDKEIQVYKTLPVIEQYITTKFSPKLYMRKELVMVMEDLTEIGFQNSAVQTFDYEHCELALTRLAKYHAGTVLLHQKDPKLVEEKVGYELVIKDSVTDRIAHFEKFISNLKNEISTWPESVKYTKYFDTIEKQFRGYYESLSKRNTLKVLNHGDFWMNNMMFKYNNCKVCDVRFVDFQICTFVSPTCDIQYFIGSSADLDVRSKRLDELYSAYLDTFNNTLAEIGVSRTLSKKEFEKNLQEDLIMYIIGVALPLAVAFTEENIDTFTLDDLDVHETHKVVDRFGTLLQNKKYRNFVSVVLDDLDKKGVFQRFKE